MHIQFPSRPAATMDGKSETAQRMLDGALLFLGSLTSEQKGRVTYPLSSEERFNWHYIPRPRRGLSFEEMDGSQQKFAHALIASGLSLEGYAKAMAIMGLEAILKDLEGEARRFPRDPDLYYITLFGVPSNESSWGWRVEGHHLSLNFLIAHGCHVAAAPNFFGSNPAQVPEGYRLSGLSILAQEESLARQLLLSMTAEKRTRIIVDLEAPEDIVTRAERRIKLDTPSGIPMSEMEAEQKKIFLDLLSVYLRRMPEEVAYSRMNEIEKEGTSSIHFAWAGSEMRGSPHYYRLHGPSFLIEYDNTQNNANHIHTVWRDIRNDWGEDLLEDHYGKSHRSHR
ncbi:MAG TPA: DUF3500 domain-containing protein [Methylomirabilota bacterium]|nr:DUF3500 domain-containing protein [Methylomirabilota bacterium]